MGILFIFTLLTCFLLFIAFLKNYQQIGEEIPHWYLITHSVEILLYVLYFALRKYIFCGRTCGLFILFLLHDIFLVSIMLLISDFSSYMYISFTLIYYTFFFGVITGKRLEWYDSDSIERSELPRKTFIEMTELNNN